ncbi:hypothetical protein LX64_00702 [Chitinophaga skermanii]|uniref:Uncharacterized protein n=1 Tax=Chitinophaga skermanii TaxID=331697 RepID=A0A327R5X6_9BACT|nr:hypothetical protein [Chitinophaga skermanii]RAJ11094.1 hypothetical protein LX64_00702 [Chitinophaga skermanii]
MSKPNALNLKRLEKVAFYPTKNGYITVERQRRNINWEGSNMRKYVRTAKNLVPLHK